MSAILVNGDADSSLQIELVHQGHAVVNVQLAKRVVDMRAHGGDRDTQAARDVLVGQTASHEMGDLALARAQEHFRAQAARAGHHLGHPRVDAAAIQRGDQCRPHEIEQLEIVAGEILAPFVAPDAHVANVVIVAPGVEVDAPVQAVASQKVVEELGTHELVLRHHVGHTYCSAMLLKLERDRVMVLVVTLVLLNVGGVHVDAHAAIKALLLLIPHVARVVLRAQQVEHQLADAGSDVAFLMRLGQRCHDAGEQVKLVTSQVHGTLPRRVGSREFRSGALFYHRRQDVIAVNRSKDALSPDDALIELDLRFRLGGQERLQSAADTSRLPGKRRLAVANVCYGGNTRSSPSGREPKYLQLGPPAAVRRIAVAGAGHSHGPGSLGPKGSR